MRKKIKAIVFDVDGVIADTAVYHYRAWRDVVAPLGVNFTPEQNITLKGMPRLQTLRAILSLNNVQQSFSEQQLVELANTKNDAYVRVIERELGPESALPGIKEFVKKAKSLGLLLPVASTSVNSPLILKKLGLYDFFDFIVDPATVVHGKPAPDIFLAALKGVGVSPDEAIGIEDALPGISGLNQAGIFSVAVTHGDEGDWSKADIVLSDTSELDLLQILKKAEA